MFDALIKVGGSLYTATELRACAAQWAALATRHRLLVVPGGGPFAGQVRAADARFGLSANTAHWMAVLAMDQYGYLLADLAPEAALVRDLGAAALACTERRLAILAPSALLLHADPLPHTWQVTSDALAAWLAGFVRVRLLVLLKAVPGIVQTDPRHGTATVLQEVPRQTLAQSDVVDPYFPQVLPPNTDCWIIDGRQPERLAELLDSGRTLGTRVIQP